MFVCQPVEAFHNLAGEGDKIYLLHSHFHLLVLDFAEVQYLIDILLVIFTAAYILFTIFRLKHKVSVEQEISDIKLI